MEVKLIATFCSLFFDILDFVQIHDQCGSGMLSGYALTKCGNISSPFKFEFSLVTYAKCKVYPEFFPYQHFVYVAEGVIIYLRSFTDFLLSTTHFLTYLIARNDSEPLQGGKNYRAFPK